MINEKIFKAYDIRGIYPDQLNEESAYAIGRAYARKVDTNTIVVGRDMRLSSPALHKELVKGIMDEGKNVLDIGLVPIDAVYYAVRIKKLAPAGVMITASHNPKEYNGFKMPMEGIGWVRGEDIKEDVKNLPEEISDTKGTMEETDIMEGFIKHVLSFGNIDKIKPFKVVVDAGNGMAGKVIPLLEKHLPIEVIPMNFELDGSFPAHPSNPKLPESQIGITKAVVEHKADFGIILDGDTDRLFFIDETGRFIPADFTLLVLAKEFIRREPGAGVVYATICSRIVKEKIEEWGGRAIEAKVGFVNIMHEMYNQKGIMGGEISAHYSFRDNGYADSGFIAFVILLELLSKENKKLSEIISEFEVYDKPEEINIEVEDSVKILERIKEHYKDEEISELDGVTVRSKDWWLNVRPSNTEPLLRINIETINKELTEEKKKELFEVINR